jgi:predicted amidohydrolase
MRFLPRLVPSVLLAAVLLVEGCRKTEVEPDLGEPPVGDAAAAPEAAISPESGAPDREPSTFFTGGAIKYGKETYAPGCTDDVCALLYFGRLARKEGAHLVVFPEYALYQKTPWDLPPAVGDTPATDPRWKEEAVVKPVAKMAAAERLFVVLNLKTEETVGGTNRKYNTSVAFDPTGKVVARHHKFELYSNYEKTTFTAGDSVEQSFFDTPAGRAGMLICSDIHCYITGGTLTPECSAAGAKLVPQFSAKKPALVLISNYWFTPANEPVWGALTVLKTVATVIPAYVAGANTTKGQGYGGGIYDPTGKELASKVSTSNLLVYADLPVAR